MNCKKIKKLLSYQIDGRLTDANLVDIINTHLDLCPSCNKERTDLVNYKTLINNNFTDVTPPALPVQFENAFYQRLNNEIRPLEPTLKYFYLRKHFTQAFALAAAAILIVIFVLPKKVLIEKQNAHLSILEESDLSMLIDSAVIKTKENELKKVVDLQAKEILQNFL